MLSYFLLKRRFDRRVHKLEVRLFELERRCERMSEALVQFGTTAGVKFLEERREPVLTVGLDGTVTAQHSKEGERSATVSTKQAQTRSSAAALDDVSVRHMHSDNNDTPASQCITPGTGRAASVNSFSSCSSSRSHTSQSHHSTVGSHSGFDHTGGDYDSGSSCDSSGSFGCD